MDRTLDDLSSRQKSSGGLAVPIEILAPDIQTVPFVYASPHSGRDYPAEFQAASRLDPISLRRSEDSFVDEIFASAADNGAPLLKACFPRAYVDPNREAYELDPAMFEDTLPGYVNTTSIRVNAGLGTVARVVTNGEEIYHEKLKFADAIRRIDGAYKPYHHALQKLIDATHQKFGLCFLIDCHSMPSIGGPMDDDRGLPRFDIVLGDCHGRSCMPGLTDMVDRVLRELGLTVRRNDPYSGGFTTRHYGRPQKGVHALQIEINRALYMDELMIERSGGFSRLVDQIENLVSAIALMGEKSLS